MNKLAQHEILALHKAAINAGLERDALLSNLPLGYKSSLPHAKSPRDRLLRDLDALNGVVLNDGTVPMEVWLQNAVHLSANLPESDVFQKMLQRCRGMSTNTETPRQTGRGPISHAKDDVVIDFGIVTAIEVERKAVCAALGLTDENRVPKESRVYWRGRLPLKNGESYEIVVAQSPDMANIDAALLTSDMLHHWKPSAALMVGIAASTDKDVHLGDVIPGSDVYYYERGKETAAGVKPEPKMIPANATLWSRVAALPDWNGQVPIARPDGSSTMPKVFRDGVIASGERVIADAAIRDAIAAKHRKIRAIEMEGYGFSRAVWQSFDQVRHLVIRGICDDASENKGDAWHAYAAATAAGYMRHFLLDCPLEPRNEPHRP